MDANISLIQGKKFKKYQNKITKNTEQSENFYETTGYSNKEGFINIFETNNKTFQNNKQQNTSNKMEFDRLNTQFTDLSTQYYDLEKTANANMNNLLERYSTKNPYNGKLVQINNGDVGYVTERGDFKLFTNSDTMSNTKGKNGCPSGLNMKVNINNYKDARIPGKVLNTSPSLLVGSYMISGQSCGNEGQNVHVNSIVPANVKTTYKGCYADNRDSHTMTFLGTVPPLSTGSLQNGNFSQPQIANNSYQYIKSNDKVPGWQFNAVLINNSIAWGFPMPYPTGKQAVCIQFSQVIGQWIQLTKGSYNISFSACGRPNQANKINIYLVINTDLTTPQSAPIIYTFTPPNSKWETYNTTFNLNENGLYILGFYGTATEDKSTAIQNIQITQTSKSDNGGTYTYDMCKDEATDNGYKYFALQNMNQSTGMGYCAVSNDEIRATKYGKSIIPVLNTILWSSKTQGNPGCSAVLNNQGSLSIVNSTGASIFSTPGDTKVASSYIGCYGDKSVRAMTFIDGGAQKYNYSTCEQVAKNGNYNFFALQNSTSGENAQCSVSNDLGTTSKYGLAKNCTKLSNGIVSGGGWSNAVYASATPSGQYYLSLDYNNSGGISISIFRGSGPTNNQGTIWQFGTTGATDANPNYTAVKGKYGTNWVPVGSTLAPGDFIGTTNGCAYLIMQTDGNLVLYTSKMGENCSADQNKHMGGGPNANALYMLDVVGNPASMGKIGFVDNDANLKEYPSSMIGKSTNYDVIKNYDSHGNDLSNMPLTNVTIDSCKTSCNNNDDCNRFVYDNNNQLCYLKNNNMFPVGKRIQSSGLDLYTRTPSLINNLECPSNLINIDSVQYDHYVKGSQMTPDDTCNTSVVSIDDTIKLNKLKAQLSELADKINKNTNNLHDNNTNINNSMDTGVKNINNDFKQYYRVKEDINKLLEKTTNQIDKKNSDKINSNNMLVVEPMLNMNDLNAMMSDSDLVVLQNNYQYILWSIVAIGVITTTITVIKK